MRSPMSCEIGWIYWSPMIELTVSIKQLYIRSVNLSKWHLHITSGVPEMQKFVWTNSKARLGLGLHLYTDADPYTDTGTQNLSALTDWVKTDIEKRKGNVAKDSSEISEIHAVEYTFSLSILSSRGQMLSWLKLLKAWTYFQGSRALQTTYCTTHSV